MFFIILGTLCLGVSVGFVLGVAYGVSQEERAAAERQAVLRTLKRMEDRRAI